MLTWLILKEQHKVILTRNILRRWNEAHFRTFQKALLGATHVQAEEARRGWNFQRKSGDRSMPIAVAVGMSLTESLSLALGWGGVLQIWRRSENSHRRNSSKKVSDSSEKIKNKMRKKGEERIISKAYCLGPSQQKVPSPFPNMASEILLRKEC